LHRSAYLLPSAFTVGNIFAGFFAVTAILNGHHGSAAIAIGIAVILDFTDGYVARLANVTTDFGSQLDSLADVISFGIAPALLIYSWGLAGLGKFASFSAFFFLMCGATRLARFNIQLKDLKHFAGLPIPAAAGFVAATVHLFGAPPEGQGFIISFAVVTYLLSFLMISTVRYPSLKQVNLGRGKSHLNVLLLAFLVAGVIWYSQPVLMALAGVYLCTGLVSRAHQFVKVRLQPKELSPEEVKLD
jgi:CDP-diacylglycerol--serine O-phosphatidyltransferase